MDAPTKERNSRLELLRIICMFLIVLRHYTTAAEWGGVFTADNWTWQVLFLQIIRFGGSAAINVFLLISGYFMISRPMNWKRIVLLIAEMIFYCYTIAAVLYNTKLSPFSVKGLIKQLLPFWFGTSLWYVVCYVVLCCFLPFLNPILNHVDRNQYRNFFFFFFLLASVARTIGIVNYLGNQYSVDWFLVMYSVGGYIRRFYDSEKKKPWGRYFLISLAVLLASIIGMSVGGHILHINALVSHANDLDPAYSIVAVFVAVFLFLWVIQSRPFTNKTINALSKSAIGVFIISQNPLLKVVIWDRIYPNIDYLRSDLLPLHCLIKVGAVFVACMIIDQIRIATIEKAFRRFLDRHWEKLTEKLKAIAHTVTDAFPF